MVEYFNVSSIRMARFLYALGFAKESYINSSGEERWRFVKTDNLTESVAFYKYMRSKNNNWSCTYGEDKQME